MRGRLLAPDFARGAMLLLIVLSNTTIFFEAVAGGTPSATPAADLITKTAMVALLDVRVYPLFAFLVGYGLARAFEARAADLGPDAARAVIRSRNRWLIVFGAVHASLLMGSEVLAAYGIIGLILCALFLGRSERRLRNAIRTGVALLGILLVAAVATLIALIVLNPAGPPSADVATYDLNGSGTTDYLASIAYRLPGWFTLLFLNGLGVVMPTAILIGMWTARRRIMEEPHKHRRLLVTAATAGITLGLAGSLPSALSTAGLFRPAPFHGLADLALFLTTWTTGLAGGLGYAALFVLISERLTRSGRAPLAVSSVAALGKRSLSGYLAHSIVMAPVLSLWGLGLAGHLTLTTAALFAFGVWLLTVVIATVMERRNVRGPFEVLLRSLGARRATVRLD